MTEQKEMRLSLAAKKLNVGIVTIVEKLAVKGHRIENNPNAKLNFELLNILSKEYNNNSLLEEGASPKPVEESKPTSAGNSEILYFRQQAKVEDKKDIEPTQSAEPEVIRAESKIQGLTVLDKIDLDKKPSPPPAPVSTPIAAVEIIKEPVIESTKTESVEKPAEFKLVTEDQPVIVKESKPVEKIEPTKLEIIVPQVVVVPEIVEIPKPEEVIIIF
jgi:translation initiation factor IF-2